MDTWVLTVSTVRHSKKESDDAILRPCRTTRRVCYSYYGDECEIAIVAGIPEGTGNTDIHYVLADAYGLQCEKILSLSRQCGSRVKSL